MREIIVPPPNDVSWNDWCDRCTTAKEHLIQEYKTYGATAIKISANLYKEQKVSFYMNYDLPFRGKCAYCDRDLHNQHGDIDHYRPKGRVADLNNEIITRTNNGQNEIHPGYYWLAYDWSNLLPSCIRCNQPNNQFTEYRIGKWDKFPVCGNHAWQPGEEANENPLLINPTSCNPNDHLIFNPNGVIGWHTPHGEVTVKILGLNEYDLPDRRRARYEQVRSLTADYIYCFRACQNCEKTISKKLELDKIKKGYGDFTTFALLAINDELDEFKAALETVPN